MAIKKQFLKSKPICKVTFEVLNPEAEQIVLLGEFNEWNQTSHPMNKMKNGKHKIAIDLETERNYAFKYLVDGNTWMLEEDADEQVESGMGAEQNSLIAL
jgi:1,4-alpha-glucan branching enzyme